VIEQISAPPYDIVPHVPLGALEPGDLIFAYTPVSHVGIYIGNGQMVHARTRVTW
jgi:cell wall-associated NlpC family hydrolase